MSDSKAKAATTSAAHKIYGGLSEEEFALDKLFFLNLKNDYIYATDAKLRDIVTPTDSKDKLWVHVRHLITGAIKIMLRCFDDDVIDEISGSSNDEDGRIEYALDHLYLHSLWGDFDDEYRHDMLRWDSFRTTEEVLTILAEQAARYHHSDASTTEWEESFTQQERDAFIAVELAILKKALPTRALRTAYRKLMNLGVPKTERY